MLEVLLTLVKRTRFDDHSFFIVYSKIYINDYKNYKCF